MPRYIDADALISDMHMKLCDLRNDSYISGDYRVGFAFCMEFVKTAPTISPDEVRGSGKWIALDFTDEAYGFVFKCSKCGCEVIGEPDYCEGCGAKMEGK